MTAMDAYRRLEGRFRRWSALREAAGMLHSDMSAMMPEGGHSSRAEQLAALDVVSHEMLTASATGDLLAEAADGNALDGWQRANLSEMHRLYVHATALDADLVEALTKACATCEAAWRQARPMADFAGVKAEVSAVTERAMRGELAFEPALRERVARLKGLPLEAVARCRAERVRLNPGARTFVRTMAAHGARTLLVSGGFESFTGPVAQAAGFQEHRANRLLDDGSALFGTVAEPDSAMVAPLENSTTAAS